MTARSDIQEGVQNNQYVSEGESQPHLPDKERLLVNYGRLNDLTSGEHAPRDCIYAGTGLVAVIVPFAGDRHVGQGRLLADGRLECLELLRRHKELYVGLLIDISALNHGRCDRLGTKGGDAADTCSHGLDDKTLFSPVRSSPANIRISGWCCIDLGL